MRWEIKFSAGSDGYERLYIDGVLYFSVNGQTSDGGGQYLKIGQNLFASPGNNSVMYFDNLNVWKKGATAKVNHILTSASDKDSFTTLTSGRVINTSPISWEYY